jgi:hypothetical protein
LPPSKHLGSNLYTLSRALTAAQLHEKLYLYIGCLLFV